ncbi:hypothetical protein R50073_17580 [Maricurvus nonylphenolicus]
MVELAREVLSRLGYSAEFHKMAFLRCLNEVQNQNMTLSPFASAYSLGKLGDNLVAINPSVQYHLPAFFLRSSDPVKDLSGIEAFAGWEIAALRGNSFARRHQHNSGIGWIFVNNNPALWKLLLSYRVDAFLAEYQSQILLSDELRQQIRILPPMEAEPLYWAVNREDAQLAQQVGEQLEQAIDDGTVDTLYRKYFGVSFRDIERMIASQEFLKIPGPGPVENHP